MRRVVKEPLVHFLVLGALLFAGHGLLNRNSAPAPARIVITQGQLVSLMETFTRTRQRPPTREEWERLIQDHVREEVYFREARALGLDQDDTVIRRRLRQKMQFISDDTAAQAEPTDADLNAYLRSHDDQFRVEARFTFRQVYLNPEKHEENLMRDATKLLAQFNQAGDTGHAAAQGDPFLLEPVFDAVSAGDVAKQFGEAFAEDLAGLQPGQWQGPVESGYGMHLVFISERKESRTPELEEVREVVRREWDNARRLEANEKFFQELLKRYSVSVEEPAPAEEKRVAAAKAP